MPAAFPRAVGSMLSAQAGKGSGKKPPAHPFFYSARSCPCAAFSHAEARFSVGMGCGMSVTGGVSCRAAFSHAAILPYPRGIFPGGCGGIPTMHVEIRLVFTSACSFPGHPPGHIRSAPQLPAPLFPCASCALKCPLHACLHRPAVPPGRAALLRLH